jgi:hypothetical protein
MTRKPTVMFEGDPSPVGMFLVKQNDTNLRAGFSDRSSLIKCLPHRGLSIHPNCR